MNAAAAARQLRGWLAYIDDGGSLTKIRCGERQIERFCRALKLDVLPKLEHMAAADKAGDCGCPECPGYSHRLSDSGSKS